jgi:hypothetical protein
MDSAALTRWHVGPWTMPATAPGEPYRPGVRRTPDEANFDVVGLARILGRHQTGGEELQVRLWQNELRPTHTRVCGRHALADPDNAAALAAKARDSFAWLAARAPAGYHFTWTDAVYLRPDEDLDAPVVALEHVVALARARGLTPDSAALATAHARRSGDAWTAAAGALILAGPFPTAAAATAAITAARADLARALRDAGHPDLAATAPRWAPVPTDTPEAPVA